MSFISSFFGNRLGYRPFIDSDPTPAENRDMPFNVNQLEQIRKARNTSLFGRRYVWFAAVAAGCVSVGTLFANYYYPSAEDRDVQERLVWINAAAQLVLAFLGFSATGCMLLRTSDADLERTVQLLQLKEEGEKIAGRLDVHQAENICTHEVEIRSQLTRYIQEPTWVEWVTGSLFRRAHELTPPMVSMDETRVA